MVSEVWILMNPRMLLRLTGIFTHKSSMLTPIPCSRRLHLEKSSVCTGIFSISSTFSNFVFGSSGYYLGVGWRRKEHSREAILHRIAAIIVTASDRDRLTLTSRSEVTSSCLESTTTHTFFEFLVSRPFLDRLNWNLAWWLYRWYRLSLEQKNIF